MFCASVFCHTLYVCFVLMFSVPPSMICYVVVNNYSVDCLISLSLLQLLLVSYAPPCVYALCSCFLHHPVWYVIITVSTVWHLLSSNHCLCFCLCVICAHVFCATLCICSVLMFFAPPCMICYNFSVDCVTSRTLLQSLLTSSTCDRERPLLTKLLSAGHYIVILPLYLLCI